MGSPLPMFLAGGRALRGDSTDTTATPFPAPVGQSAGAWTGVFRDEFDAFPSTSKWQMWHLLEGAYYQANDNPDEVQAYTRDLRGLSQSGSVLTITARHENPYTFDPLVPNPLPSGQVGTYTSSLIQSHPSFNCTYGYYEGRIKFPPASTGQWSSFWLSSSDGSWPPEIDIFDAFSGTTISYNIWPDTGAQYQDSHGFSPDGQFHVWACKWSPAGVTYYMDGVQVSTTTTTSTGSMHLIFNLAVQATASFSSAAMEVDYIRAWVPVGVPAQPVITSVTPSTGIPTAGSLTVAFNPAAGATSYRATVCAVDAHADGVVLASNVHQVATGSASPLTVTGLTNGAHYTVSVAAINGTGYSIESALVPALS